MGRSTPQTTKTVINVKYNKIMTKLNDTENSTEISDTCSSDKNVKKRQQTVRFMQPHNINSKETYKSTLLSATSSTNTELNQSQNYTINNKSSPTTTNSSNSPVPGQKKEVHVCMTI